LVIGPILVVPKPTFITPTYSSSIFRIFNGFTVEIPLNEKIVAVVEIPPPLPDSELSIFVYIKGYCTILSKVIIVFSTFFTIENWWAFPSPGDVKVTADPNLVVEIWNVSSVLLTTKIEDGKESITDPLSYNIGVDPTPTKVDFGV